MSTDQAVARLRAKAAELREKGQYAAAHDWQRYASEMARLVGLAESTCKKGGAA